MVRHERGALYNTGDLIRWLGDGKFKFVSRQKGAHIKVRGYKVFPYLIEDVMHTHPAIDTAWVAGVGTDDTNTRLEAALFLKADSKIEDEAELRDWLQKRLPHYMIPAALHKLPERPVQLSGKAKVIADRLLPDCYLNAT